MDNPLVPLEDAAPKAVETTNETVPAEGAVADSKETKPLSSEEQRLLQETEKVIEIGLGQFLEVGNALMKINSRRLYRGTFKTFEEYCQVRWGLGSNYAHRLIKSAECVARLKEAAITEKWEVLPSNESQVRSLTRLKPKQQVTAWKRVVKKANGNVTAEVVDEVVNGMPGKTSRKGSAKSAKQNSEHQLKSIAKLVSKELKKSGDLKPDLKKLLKKILELTGESEKSAK